MAGATKKKITCFVCGEENHIVSNCPKKDQIPQSEWAIKTNLYNEQGEFVAPGTENTNNSRELNSNEHSRAETRFGFTGVTLMSIKDKRIPITDSTICLDSGSTLNALKNARLCGNVRKTES